MTLDLLRRYVDLSSEGNGGVLLSDAEQLIRSSYSSWYDLKRVSPGGLELPNVLDPDGPRASVAGSPATLLDEPSARWWFPGTANNYLSFPNPEAGAIGDIDLRIRANRTSGTGYMFGCLQGSAGQGRWGFYWNGINIGVYFVDNAESAGTKLVNISAFTNLTLGINDRTYWFRLRRVSGVWTMWVEPDQETEPSWTTPVSLGTSDGGDLFDSTQPYRIMDGGAPSEGHFYYLKLITAAGTVEVDADSISTTGAPDAGQSSFAAVTGQTVTVSRSATLAKSTFVPRPVMSTDGVNDLIQLPAEDTPTFTATTGKDTRSLLCRIQGTTNNGAWLWSSESAGADGARLRLAGSGSVIAAECGGSSANVGPTTTPVESGVLRLLSIVVDEGTMSLYVDDTLIGSTSLASVGTITHAAPRIATDAYGNTLNGEFELFAQLNGPGVALSPTDLGTIAELLKSGVYSVA